MYYYVLPKIGTGTNDDPYRPDVPVGISFVGNEIRDGVFLVGTPVKLTGKSVITQAQIENYCYNNRIKTSDVLNKWFAGGV